MKITGEQATEWAARRYLSYQEPEASPARKQSILPLYKYNILVKGFNLGTVLLAAAVAATILFSYSTAFVWGAIGLFARFITEREIRKYYLPPFDERIPQQAQPMLAMVGLNPQMFLEMRRMMQAFAYALGIRLGGNAALFQKLNIPAPQGWEEDRWVILENSLWKNTVPVPPDPTRPPPPPAQEPPVVPEEGVDHGPFPPPV